MAQILLCDLLSEKRKYRSEIRSEIVAEVIASAGACGDRGGLVEECRQPEEFGGGFDAR